MAAAACAWAARPLTLIRSTQPRMVDASQQSRIASTAAISSRPSRQSLQDCSVSASRWPSWHRELVRMQRAVAACSTYVMSKTVKAVFGAWMYVLRSSSLGSERILTHLAASPAAAPAVWQMRCTLLPSVSPHSTVRVEVCWCMLRCGPCIRMNSGVQSQAYDDMSLHICCVTAERGQHQITC